MRPSQTRRLTIIGLIMLGSCLIYPLAYRLLHWPDRFKTPTEYASQSLELAAAAAAVQQPAGTALRLESWGECHQSATRLLVAAISPQSDRLGRERLREEWQKWHIGHAAAQLMFFVAYDRRASRSAIVNEFHARQDIMLDAGLARQDELGLLQSAVTWFLHRCPGTRHLLFVGPTASLSTRRVALHTAGGFDDPDVNGGRSKTDRKKIADSKAAPTSLCLLLPRETVERLVQNWPAAKVVGVDDEISWPAVFRLKGFNATARDGARMFCTGEA